MAIVVREVTADDRTGWLRLRTQLWPGAAHEHADEIDRWYAGKQKEPATVLLACDDERLVGFAELSIRAYAEKCDTQNVAYLEGWFVEESHRRRGVGRRLLEAARAWGRSRGCSEFASDSAPDNAASIAAHVACGFEDVGLIRCFRQRI